MEQPTMAQAGGPIVGSTQAGASSAPSPSLQLAASLSPLSWSHFPTEEELERLALEWTA